MKKIRTLVIDDEALARSLMLEYLAEIPSINVIGTAANGFDGVKQIHELKPDLVFLDIQMPKINGFELLEMLDDKPYVIFTTAYDQYAIKAFEEQAIDYLLKPFAKERLLQAVTRVTQLLAAKEPIKVDTSRLLTNSSDSEHLNRIVVKTGKQIKILPTENIDFLEADDDYVAVYCGGNRYLKQQTMKFYEEHLDPSLFVRIHRSYIVRVNTVVGIEAYSKDSHIVKLTTGKQLKVSTKGYQRLKQVLNL